MHLIGTILLTTVEVSCVVTAVVFFGYIGYLVISQVIAEWRDPVQRERARMRRVRVGFAAPYHSTAKALRVQKLRDAVAAGDWGSATLLAKQVFPDGHGAEAYIAEKCRAANV